MELEGGSITIMFSLLLRFGTIQDTMEDDNDDDGTFELLYHSVPNVGDGEVVVLCTVWFV